MRDAMTLRHMNGGVGGRKIEFGPNVGTERIRTERISPGHVWIFPGGLRGSACASHVQSPCGGGELVFRT